MQVVSCFSNRHFDVADFGAGKSLKVLSANLIDIHS